MVQVRNSRMDDIPKNTQAIPMLSVSTPHILGSFLLLLGEGISGVVGFSNLMDSTSSRASTCVDSLIATTSLVWTDFVSVFTGSCSFAEVTGGVGVLVSLSFILEDWLRTINQKKENNIVVENKKEEEGRKKWEKRGSKRIGLWRNIIKKEHTIEQDVRNTIYRPSQLIVSLKGVFHGKRRKTIEKDRIFMRFGGWGVNFIFAMMMEFRVRIRRYNEVCRYCCGEFVFFIVIFWKIRESIGNRRWIMLQILCVCEILWF